ncbi:MULTISPECIES: saccharopine dehydrogenase family protein [Alcaligenaceae]|uniref:Carboxynorspermidine dehydrogenase n=2 Tax=Alcaligenaceae TaxID=506 RepID=A0A366H535_9BURK|nr:MULTISPECIES: saccharopine dehydrogenase family protein [Alcaligenaceae]MCI2810652.1 saccharopine dehydrogenase family protein [Eoetvoesiella caeni]NYT56564.1 saccharopine dehydrogenase family protein [Eoetvoesiella caeni]RBP36275.1 carboxynorspermidine dehydrogenase [Eoetvoesiella caeni]RIY38872.1 saccharopine dehydrogenase [Neopusillimonas maritima]
MKRNVLIIGAGGVAHVAAHKCAQNNILLGDIHIASRTLSKCQAIIASIKQKGSQCGPGRLQAHALDAMDVEATKALIRATKSQIVINVGSPFLNMSVLAACIETGAAYLDTAIHEDPDKVCEAPPWYENHEWKRREACRQAGVTAILGVGFDPGVVNAYGRYALDTYFDSVDSIDIIDINAGGHGRYFATNFDPEINFREFTSTVWSWEKSQWKANAMFERSQDWDMPVVGTNTTYLTGHDELHSMSKNLGVPNIRFWMGFGDHYINVFTVLKNLGLLSEKPVRTAEGLEVVPLKVVKAVLPDPASLAPNYTGKTCIGDLVKGKKNGKPHEVLIYNICDHEQSYAEVGSQAISYTAGVPVVAAAMLIADGAWDIRRMANVEELDPKPFIELMNRIGLVTRIRDSRGDRVLQPHDESATVSKTRSMPISSIAPTPTDHELPQQVDASLKTRLDADLPLRHA